MILVGTRLLGEPDILDEAFLQIPPEFGRS